MPEWIWCHICFKEFCFIYFFFGCVSVVVCVYVCLNLYAFLNQNSRHNEKFLWPKCCVLHKEYFHLGKSYGSRESKSQDSNKGSKANPFVPLSQSRCLCLMLRLDKKKKTCVGGNHHLLFIVYEWSITVRLNIVVHIHFWKQFSAMQKCAISENQHAIEEIFLRAHI